MVCLFFDGVGCGMADDGVVHGYKFHAHNTEGIWTPYYILWDYYNGLVRVHDLFTCCKPGKVSLVRWRLMMGGGY